MAKTCGLRALLFLTLILLGAPVTQAKILKECEVVQYLRSQRASSSEIPIWTCIAHYESRYNTRARSPVNRNGSRDNGIFQLNDKYWCRNSGVGGGCKKNCAMFRDDNINDDWTCVKTVYKETQRLRGNGFLAWSTFNSYCSNGRAEANFARKCMVAGQRCFVLFVVSVLTITPSARASRFTYCEMNNLLRQLSVPEDDVAIWMCIIYFESKFDTSAISPDKHFHGLFQISDFYWCHKKREGGKCKLNCDSLRDDDIKDDWACVQKIYADRERRNNDGFTAWSAYSMFCKDGRAKRNFNLNCTDNSNKN
ncbi:hypothetical protein B566_EDAN017360 [Ephemera danica]|nr:hypothetical protein B566_EDAN017360 [Ephemera danica]